MRCEAFFSVSIKLFEDLEKIRIKNNSYILDYGFNAPYLRRRGGKGSLYVSGALA